MDIDSLLLSNEEIAKAALEAYPGTQPDYDIDYDLIKAILKTQLENIKKAGYVQLDKNQELPQFNYNMSNLEQLKIEIKVKQDMLKDGFKRVKE